MPKPQVTELVSASVYMQADGVGRGYGTITREEAYLSFNTEWRGKPAFARVTVSRYVTADDNWTEWRAYVSEAREINDGSSLGVNALSDTARLRIGETCEPLAYEWLASEDYRIARVEAIADAIRNKLRDTRPYGSPPTREARRLLELHGDELDARSKRQLTKAADLYDEFVAVLG